MPSGRKENVSPASASLSPPSVAAVLSGYHSQQLVQETRRFLAKPGPYACLGLIAFEVNLAKLTTKAN